MGRKLIADSAICRLIANAVPHYNGQAITPDMNLRTALGFDSIGLITMVFILEEELGIDLFSVSKKLTEAVSVADIVAAVKACVEQQS